MHEQTSCLDGECNQCDVMEYSGKKKSCVSEGLPAPAMAAIFSTVSDGDWFPTTSGVVGVAKTNSKQQGDHPLYTIYNNPF